MLFFHHLRIFYHTITSFLRKHSLFIKLKHLYMSLCFTWIFRKHLLFHFFNSFLIINKLTCIDPFKIYRSISLLMTMWINNFIILTFTTNWLVFVSIIIIIYFILKINDILLHFFPGQIGRFGSRFLLTKKFYKGIIIIIL